jgi:hypothetical protein
MLSLQLIPAALKALTLPKFQQRFHKLRGELIEPDLAGRAEQSAHGPHFPSPNVFQVQVPSPVL